MFLTLTANSFPRPQISHVIFDFDGTLSWLRHGWPQMMVELFRPYYQACPGETEAEIRHTLLSEILSLNGKQTIFQMIRFHERVHGKCPMPEELLHEYQSRLDRAIAQRTELIRTGQAAPDQFVIHGARALLEKLSARGLLLIVLSGTIEHRVKEEAKLLGLDHYFAHHIYGSTLDPAHFSKKLVIDRLLREEKISGHHLLSFGDGPIEIAETKAVGGLAIAVATDEEQNGSGKLDPFKKTALTQAGADALIPDFRNPDQFIKTIFD